MNKKEVLEIKKQFKPSECCISRMSACYVNGEREATRIDTSSFLTLPEEEIYKYFEIFKKSLSGSIGKNLLNLDFPLQEEAEDGMQKFLLDLRNSELKDEELLENFFDSIITHYDYAGNYLILLTLSNYDVPGKTTDGHSLEDASDEVYTYLLCSICPVERSKPGLSYNEETKCVENRYRDLIVKAPDTAFLFPAFNDRGTDLHACLYYTRDGKELREELIEHVLGCPIPMAAESQKKTFQSIITDTLGVDCDYETVKNIHDNLTELMEESKLNEEMLVLDKEKVRNLFETSGVDDALMEHFEENYNSAIGKDAELIANNVADTKTFQVKTPNVTIKVDPEMSHLVQEKEIDGEKCLVVRIDGGVEVNGIMVKDKLK